MACIHSSSSDKSFCTLFLSGEDLSGDHLFRRSPSSGESFPPTDLSGDDFSGDDSEAQDDPSAAALSTRAFARASRSFQAMSSSTFFMSFQLAIRTAVWQQ